MGPAPQKPLSVVTEQKYLGDGLSRLDRQMGLRGVGDVGRIEVSYGTR